MTRLSRAAASAALALAVAACTFLGSRDVIQCQKDTDCPSARPMCSENLCVASSVTAVDSGPAVDGEAGAPDCTRTDDCDQSQLPQLCVAQKCRPATGPACPLLLPADASYRQDGAIVVGVYVSDPLDVIGKRAVELALSEIDAVLQRPKLVALVCGKGASLDKNTAQNALGHLADLQVPLVIGQFESSELGKIVLQAVDRDVAVWSTLANTSSLPTTGDSKGLYRFFLDELKSTVPAYQSALDQALARAETLAGGPIASPKVSLVVSETAESRSLADALTAAAGGLQIGGQPIASHPGFEKISVQAIFDQPSTSYQPTFSKLASTSQPNVVLALGGDEMVQKIISGTETNWGAAARPVWIVSSRAKYNANDLVNLTSRPGFRARLLGVDFSGDTTNHDAFVAAAQAKSSPFAVHAFDHLYDAMFAVAYAAVAADRGRAQPTARITAKDMLDGLAMLAPPEDGAAVLVNGSGAFPTGVTALRQNTKIRVIGTTGPWTFDEAHVTRRMGSSFFCFKNGTSQIAYYVDPAAASGVCTPP